MKKTSYLLSLVILAGIFNLSSANAQCTFGNVGIKINSTSPGPLPGTCIVNFDFYFDVDHNAGGKYFWIHIWPTGSYPNYSYPQSLPPTTSQIAGGNGILDNSISTFGYFHQGSALTPQLSYPPDNNIPGFQSGYTLTEIPGTPDRYTAHGLMLTLPQPCTVAQSLTADLWESQSDHSQTVACFSKNQPFYLNDPTILNGLLFCGLPRTYKFDINTLSVAPKTVNYLVSIDYNDDGIYNSVTDTPVVSNGSTVISNISPYHSGIQSYLPYSSQKPYTDRALWVVVLKNSSDLPNDIYARLDNTCIPLPVQFIRFSAVRNYSRVTLNWTTDEERDNLGFYLERKNGDRDWVTLAFIPSQSASGNSMAELQYTYTDDNRLPGVSLYRLCQVNFDNRFSYSETKMVKGTDQYGKVIVFPNPSADGQLNIILDKLYDGAVVRLADRSGMLIKEWDNIISGRLQVHGVPSGLYILQVLPKTVHEPLVLKVVINNK